MPKCVAIYARVSTRDQKERNTIQNQLIALRDCCAKRGFEIASEYIDAGVSGMKDNRPQLEALKRDARQGKFEIVLVWSFDRFARSTRHLLEALDEFKKLKIDFIAYQTNIDTSTAAGKMFFTVLAAIAEFEREIIRQRILAGLGRARLNGKKLGRKPWKLTPQQKDLVGALHFSGMSTRAIAKQLGISPSYAWRLVNSSKQTGVKEPACPYTSAMKLGTIACAYMKIGMHIHFRAINLD